MKTLESSIESCVVRWANNHGVLHIKLNVSGRRGWPDRIFWTRGGRPALIEFKKPGAKPRPLQQHIIWKLEELGYDVCYTDNAEDAIRFIRGRSDD